jgi:hypothetical protein
MVEHHGWDAPDARLFVGEDGPQRRAPVDCNRSLHVMQACKGTDKQWTTRSCLLPGTQVRARTVSGKSTAARERKGWC